jgi:hypothetical protein
VALGMEHSIMFRRMYLCQIKILRWAEGTIQIKLLLSGVKVVG